MSGATMTNTGAALAYAEEFGWHVFTLSPNGDGKLPYGGTSGLKDATADTEQIQAVFKKRPRARIGIRTGSVSGIFVLDIDGKGGAEALAALVDEHGELPRTRTHGTRGGGEHRFFKHPGGCKIKSVAHAIGQQLDIRGDGGYVVAPPSSGYSVIDDSEVAEAPAWLLELVVEEGGDDEDRDRDWQPSGRRPSREVLGWLKDGDWPAGEQEARIPRVTRSLLDWGKSEDEITDLIFDALTRSTQSKAKEWTRKDVAFHVHNVATSPPPRKRPDFEVMFDEKQKPVLPTSIPENDDIAGLCVWLTSVLARDPKHPVTGAEWQGRRGPDGHVVLKRAGAPDIAFEPAKSINTGLKLAEILSWNRIPTDQEPHGYTNAQCTRIAFVIGTLCDFSQAITREQEAAGIVGTFTQGAAGIEGHTTYGTNEERYNAATILRGTGSVSVNGESIGYREPRYLIDVETGELVIQVAALQEAARRHIGSSLRHGWLDALMQDYGWQRIELQAHAGSGRDGRTRHVRISVYRGVHT